MPISSILNAYAAVGTYTVTTARKFHGATLYASGAAATLVVYKGAAATAGKEVCALRVPDGQTVCDAPAFEVELDPDGGLYVAITGTGAQANVRYGT